MQLITRVDKALFQRVQEVAQASDRSVAYVMRLAIREFVEREAAR